MHHLYYSNPPHFFELHRKEDIDKLTSYFDVEHLHYVATDLFSNHMPETIDQMSHVVYELYIKYHFSICERTDMDGLSHHSLDIFRKNNHLLDYAIERRDIQCF